MTGLPETIKLGFSKSDACAQQIKSLQGFFEKEGQHLVCQSMSAPDIESGLLNAAIDLGLRPLDSLPITLPENLRIAGLSERHSPADHIFSTTEKFKPGFIHLIKNGRFGVLDLRAKGLIENFSQKNNAQILSNIQGSFFDLLETHQLDALVLPDRYKEFWQEENLVIHSLNPEEFIPTPGQGAWAILGNIAQKPLLKWVQQKYHNSSTALVTNIERGLLRSMGEGFIGKMGAYCRMDNDGNYHAWAAFKANEHEALKFGKFSSSTSHGLTDRILTQLNEM